MSVEQRLPIVNSDDGAWGDILNKYIEAQHYNSGVDDPLNGSHKTVIIRPGTTSSGTAPLKFISGSLLTSPEAGAVEFLSDSLYFTQTTGLTRRKIASYSTSGSVGDMYYRNSSGDLQALTIGSTNQILSVSGGAPAWQTPSGSVNNMDGGAASAVYGGSTVISGGYA